jgi:hypothetical protein
MKYIITESKLEKVATDYINELFPEDNLHLQYMMDDDGEIEAMKVYLGNPDDDLMCFRWYSAEYFHGGTSHREKSPMVVLEDEYLFSLNGYFGDAWHEPFKRWFTEYFNLPLKTVE